MPQRAEWCNAIELLPFSTTAYNMHRLAAMLQGLTRTCNNLPFNSAGHMQASGTACCDMNASKHQHKPAQLRRDLQARCYLEEIATDGYNGARNLVNSRIVAHEAQTLLRQLHRNNVRAASTGHCNTVATNSGECFHSNCAFASVCVQTAQ